MPDTNERLGDNYVRSEVLLGQYVTRAINAVKCSGSEDHEDLITVLRNFRSDIMRQTLADLLADIKENCQEESYEDFDGDGNRYVYKYYTIDVEEIEELIKRARM